MMKMWVLVLGILLVGFMPIQAEDTGTISIDLKYVDEQETMAISGATVSIYQVWKYDADRKVEMISPFTYIISAVGTFIVSYLTNKLLARKIKKIDMVSSLKGNE